MKRTERRHLKENPLAHSIVTAREYIQPRTRQLGIVAGALVLIVLAAVVITMLRGRESAAAQRALAEAMVALNARVIATADPDTDNLPAAAALGNTGTFSTEAAKLRAALPKLQAAADGYPETPSGTTARYHLAGALAALGRNDEALKEFAQVVERAGSDSIYGRMARMGYADAQARAGQLDGAIASWKELADAADSEIPKDAVLIELARAYVAKGDMEEARKTFTQLVDEHPTSPYTSVARQELDALEG
jgi:tetratricopeptide (TPR) repeat protein